MATLPTTELVPFYFPTDADAVCFSSSFFFFEVALFFFFLVAHHDNQMAKAPSLPLPKLGNCDVISRCSGGCPEGV
eukprot:m.520836 g.520836  ORF g.520836 m.520836 type:complete len:76 (+) comp141925_c0_seq1:63-290(+)